MLEKEVRSKGGECNPALGKTAAAKAHRKEGWIHRRKAVWCVG